MVIGDKALGEDERLSMTSCMLVQACAVRFRGLTRIVDRRFQNARAFCDDHVPFFSGVDRRRRSERGQQENKSDVSPPHGRHPTVAFSPVKETKGTEYLSDPFFLTCHNGREDFVFYRLSRGMCNSPYERPKITEYMLPSATRRSRSRLENCGHNPGGTGSTWRSLAVALLRYKDARARFHMP